MPSDAIRSGVFGGLWGFRSFSFITNATVGCSASAPAPAAASGPPPPRTVISTPPVAACCHRAIGLARSATERSLALAPRPSVSASVRSSSRIRSLFAAFASLHAFNFCKHGVRASSATRTSAEETNGIARTMKRAAHASPIDIATMATVEVDCVHSEGRAPSGLNSKSLRSVYQSRRSEG